jgi:8-oxo-dGTP pyrophosphatase MutT (NUDIX family)
MDVIYAGEPLPERTTLTLFLAGPTPRAATGSPAVRAWRQEALVLLEAMGFTGQVLIPEPRGGWSPDYDGQIAWECAMRACADIIIFYVPRRLAGWRDSWSRWVPAAWRGAGPMPAFTTNIEFGEDLPTGRVVYGRPDGAPKNRYLDARYREATGWEPCRTLDETLRAALRAAGEPVERTGAARCVPAAIWRAPTFQDWWASRHAAGHRVDAVRVTRVSGAPEPGATPFFWALEPTVWVPEEGRHKSNEVAFGRPDVACVVPVLTDGPQWELGAVEEVRLPGQTASGRVLEWPGGSDPLGSTDMAAVALSELEEELGVVGVDPGRLVPLGARQVSATSCIHRCHAFALLLTYGESQDMRSRLGRVLCADGEERTRLVVLPVEEWEHAQMDWCQVGVGQAALRALRPRKGWWF